MGQGGRVNCFFHSDSNLIPAKHHFCESGSGSDLNSVSPRRTLLLIGPLM